jgi:hypothetical protein
MQNTMCAADIRQGPVTPASFPRNRSEIRVHSVPPTRHILVHRPLGRSRPRTYHTLQATRGRRGREKTPVAGARPM